MIGMDQFDGECSMERRYHIFVATCLTSFLGICELCDAIMLRASTLVLFSTTCTAYYFTTDFITEIRDRLNFR